MLHLATQIFFGGQCQNLQNEPLTRIHGCGRRKTLFWSKFGICLASSVNVFRIQRTQTFKLYISYTYQLIKSSMKNKGNYKSPDQISKLILQKIKPEDLMHRGFLKPIEIALKTFKTQQHAEDNKLKANSLPNGLKIVVKQSILQNKYDLANVFAIDKKKLQNFKAKNQNNILSLIKSNHQIQLAICVCMYSQDSRMLKSTLSGIEQNIANIIAKQENLKITSDKIGVFVIMDGIEKVDDSVVDYFEQLERSNSVYLGQNVEQAISVEEMAKKMQTMTAQEIQEQQMKNMNTFLFDAAELEERNNCRFKSVRQQYLQIKTILSQIKDLKTKKPLFGDLSAKLQQFFRIQARKKRAQDYRETKEETQKISDQIIEEEYTLDLRKLRPLVIKALAEAQIYCKNYLNSRQDLTYLASYRKKIFYQNSLSQNFKKQQLKKKHYGDRKDNQKQNKKQEEENQDFKQRQYFTYMNLFMCVKYKNSGKLSSHNWFFNGFCKELKPKYAVLLDVGLRPQGQALHKMYKYMVKNRKIGGVCGYMSLKLQRIFQNEQIKDDEVDFLTNIALKFSDIQRTQQVEYHFAHLIDKPFEAFFDFIHVLPGAFSAYNMEAIFDYEAQDDDELLKSYFKSIDDKIKNNTIKTTHLSVGNVITRVVIPDFVRNWFVNIDQESDQQMLYNENIYLAEDRILCMGIHKKNFDMAYLPDAYAEVDPIKTVHGLLGQRKRWINGSFFAFEKVKKELSSQSQREGCECMLHIQLFYLTLMNSLSYFAPSLFLFTVHIAMEAFRADVLTKVLGGVVPNPEKSEFYNSFVYTVDFIYVMLVGSIIFYSLHLTNNNKKFKPYIYAVSTLLGIFSVIVFLVLLVDIIRGLVDNQNFLQMNAASAGQIPGGVSTINILRWIAVGTTSIYILPIIIYIIFFRKPSILFEIILGAFSFLFYGPTYLNILNIYSLCRIDDISWGTKGLDSGESTKNSTLKESWRTIKYIHVTKYVLWNIAAGATLLSFGSSYVPRFFITIVFIGIITLTLAIKILIGSLYTIFYKLKTCCYQGSRHLNLYKDSQIDTLLYEQLFPVVKKEVQINLENIKQQYKKGNYLLFSKASGSKILTKKSYIKQKKQYNQSVILSKKIKKQDKPLQRPQQNINHRNSAPNKTKLEQLQQKTLGKSQKLSQTSKRPQKQHSESNNSQIKNKKQSQKQNKKIQSGEKYITMSNYKLKKIEEQQQQDKNNKMQSQDSQKHLVGDYQNQSSGKQIVGKRGFI